MVIDHGGHINLAKDQWLNAEQAWAMYPSFARFLALKDRMNPKRIFLNDLSRRLLLPLA